VELYGRNLTAKKAVAQSYLSSSLFGFPVVGTLIDPLTYGIKVGFSF
jgi:iron complex outermembrane recepter protein